MVNFFLDVFFLRSDGHEGAGSWISCRGDMNTVFPISLILHTICPQSIYICGTCFISGPLPCTIDDFWLMIWKFECTVITMLTKLREKHKVSVAFPIENFQDSNWELLVETEIMFCLFICCLKTGHVECKHSGFKILF